MMKAGIKKSVSLLSITGLVLIVILLQSCGQKGDLILPDDAAKAEQEKKKQQRLF